MKSALSMHALTKHPKPLRYNRRVIDCWRLTAPSAAQPALGNHVLRRLMALSAHPPLQVNARTGIDATLAPPAPSQLSHSGETCARWPRVPLPVLPRAVPNSRYATAPRRMGANPSSDGIFCRRGWVGTHPTGGGAEPIAGALAAGPGETRCRGACLKLGHFLNTVYFQ